MNRKEYEDIKAVCAKYGHGNVMALAGALWAKELRDADSPEEVAFVPTCIYAIKEGKWLKATLDSITIYDAIVKNMEGD